jgi:hypothetical protein
MVFAIPAIAAGLACGGGCAPGPIYGPDAPRSSIGEVTARRTWIATGNLDKPDLATDGDLNTMAVGRAGNPPPSLKIDLGQACTFNFVVVDHGRDELAFARRVEIATSVDGRTFTPRLVGPGTRRVSNFMLPSTVLARYVRITAVEPGAKPWVVAEVYFQ